MIGYAYHFIACESLSFAVFHFKLGRKCEFIFSGYNESSGFVFSCSHFAFPTKENGSLTGQSRSEIGLQKELHCFCPISSLENNFTVSWEIPKNVSRYEDIPKINFRKSLTINGNWLFSSNGTRKSLVNLSRTLPSDLFDLYKRGTNKKIITIFLIFPNFRIPNYRSRMNLDNEKTFHPNIHCFHVFINKWIKIDLKHFGDYLKENLEVAQARQSFLPKD